MNMGITKINQDTNEVTVEDMNEDEIREALFYLYDNNQLSPDGRKIVEYMKYLMSLNDEELAIHLENKDAT